MSLEILNNAEKQEITEVLTGFGLRDKEQSVYLALLTFSPQTLSPLAILVGLPPTTVQSILVRLVKMGLVSMTAHKSRHLYEANDPQVLKKILEKRMYEVGNILPWLKKIQGEAGSVPKIKIYYRERIADIFLQALECQEKKVYEIIAAQDRQELLGEKFHWRRRRVAAGIWLKSLRVEEREIKKWNEKINRQQLREARFLPRELTFHSSLMFWDNTVAFFTTKEEGLSFTVENQAWRETVGQIFELLWSVSRKMETLSEAES